MNFIFVSRGFKFGLSIRFFFCPGSGHVPICRSWFRLFGASANTSHHLFRDNISLEGRQMAEILANEPPNCRLTQTAIPGSIFWLPSYEACAGSLICDLDEGSYNHPVLVLTTNSKQESATVLIVRTQIFSRPGSNNAKLRRHTDVPESLHP